MELLFLLTIFIVFIAVMIYFERKHSKESVERIRQHLLRRNLEPLDIVRRNYNTITSKGFYYIVDYMNSNNEVYRANCQFGSNFQLFWTEPVFRQRLSPEQAERMRLRARGVEEITPYEPKSEKERLIDGLKSSYKYERIGTAKNIREMEAVDDQVMLILKELSVSDPEPEVREAAQGTIQSLDRLS